MLMEKIMARTGSYSILTTSGAILVSLVALISPTLTLGDVGRAEESLPIDTDLVILDTNSHYYSLWSDDSCHYIDDYYYLLAYGCPATNVVPHIEDSTGHEGYWSTCARASCRLTFNRNSTVLPEKPTSITIRSYLKGGAEITVKARSNIYDLDCTSDCVHVGTITAAGWTESTLSINTLDPRNRVIIVDLISNGDEGVVLVDKVTLKLPYAITTTSENPNGATSLVKAGYTSIIFLLMSIARFVL